MAVHSICHTTHTPWFSLTHLPCLTLTLFCSMLYLNFMASLYFRSSYTHTHTHDSPSAQPPYHHHALFCLPRQTWHFCTPTCYFFLTTPCFSSCFGSYRTYYCPVLLPSHGLPHLRDVFCFLIAFTLLNTPTPQHAMVWSFPGTTNSAASPYPPNILQAGFATSRHWASFSHGNMWQASSWGHATTFHASSLDPTHATPPHTHTHTHAAAATMRLPFPALLTHHHTCPTTPGIFCLCNSCLFFMCSHH